MPRADIIDISHWNEVSSFGQVADAGIVGVIHKATEGTTYIDPTYWPRREQALDAGLCWGAYHFLKHGNAADQMDWFVEQARLPSGARWAIDYEDGNCTLDDLFVALEALAGLDPTAQICVYAGGLLKGQVDDGAAYPWLEPYPLWIAHYASKPTWPTHIWPHYTLWQFTDKGGIKGIDGACDLNHFNGSKDNCAAWMGPVEIPVVESVVTVKLNVEAPEGVTIRLVVNGEEVTP